MRRTRWLLIEAACLSVLSGANAAPQWLSVKDLPQFNDAKAQLQVLADKNGHQKVNRFCVVGQKDGKYLQAFVSWPNENKLILWIPHLYDSQALVNSKRYWDLKRDVVEGDDVHGSTYLLTRSNANAMLAACRTYGDFFVIDRFAAEVPHNG